MLFRCIFNTFCIVCYIIYFIYISHVVLLCRFFLSAYLLCTWLYLSSNKFNLILRMQNILLFRIWSHPLPFPSRTSVLVSRLTSGFVYFCLLFASATETWHNFLLASILRLLNSVANRVFSPASGWLHARSCHDCLFESRLDTPRH